MGNGVARCLAHVCAPGSSLESSGWPSIMDNNNKFDTSLNQAPRDRLKHHACVYLNGPVLTMQISGESSTFTTRFRGLFGP